MTTGTTPVHALEARLLSRIARLTRTPAPLHTARSTRTLTRTATVARRVREIQRNAPTTKETLT